MTPAVYADDEIEERIVQFDSAWSRQVEPGGSPSAPVIDDYLAIAEGESDLGQRRELLTQLVMVDLEYRHRTAGQRENGHHGAETSRASTQGPVPAAATSAQSRGPVWRIEQYLVRYPELGNRDDLSLELIGQEFRVRQRWGDQPRHDEYLARFPRHVDSLPAVLSQIDAEVAHEARRRVPADTRFGRFELLEILGEGGMGTVFRALDTGLARVVALKMIRTGQLATPAEVSLFRQEAETAARLHHPNIVTVHEVGEQQGQQFFSMQVVDGPNLAEYSPELAERPKRAARLVATIARAVHYAHQRGVLHRDLKPSNILLDGEGRPYVSDFGLAKRLDADTTATHSAALAGTPSFMSPEQAAGRKDLITTATDVYGLGAVLYAILAGRPPFTGETPAEVQRRVLDEPPAPLRRDGHAIDRDLETICLKCLDKEPLRRYGSAEAVAEDLERYVSGEPIVARPVSAIVRIWRWCRRRPLVAGLSAAVLLLAATLAIGVPVVAVQRNYTEKVEQLATLNDIRQLRAGAIDGWSNRTRALLATAGQRGVDPERIAEFRTELVAALDGLDTREIVRIDGDKGVILGIDFSADGAALYTSGTDGSVVAWDFNLLMPKEDENDTRARANAARRGTLPLGEVKEGRGESALVRRLVGDTMMYAKSPRVVAFHSLDVEKPLPRPLDGDADVRGFDSVASGKRIVLARADGSAAVYDMVDEKWEEIRQISVFVPPAEPGAPLAVPVAISGDGKLVAAVVGPRREIRLFRADDPQHEGTALARHRNYIKALRFSRDGQWVASASNDYVAKVFDTSLHEHPVTLHGHAGPVNAIDFSPDGEMVATGSEDGTVRLWQTRTGQQKRILYPSMETVFSVAFAPDGRHLVIGGVSQNGIGRFAVYEVSQDRIRQTLRRHDWSSVEGLAVHPTRPLAATAANDREIIIWDLNTRERLRTLPPFDGTEIAKMKAKLDKTPPLAPTATVRVAFSPDGEWLAVSPLDVKISNREAPEQDLAIKFWRWEKGQRPERPLKGHKANITASAFDPSGERFLSGDKNGVACVWRLPNGERESRWEEPKASIIGVAWSADGSQVVVAYEDGRIRIHDPANGETLRETKIDDRLSTLASAQQSGQIVLGAASGQIYVVTLDNLTARRLHEAQRAAGLTPAVPDETSSALALTHDGRWLATARGRLVSLWDLSADRFILDLPRHDAPVYALGFDSRGETLVVTGREEDVTVWDWQRIQRELTGLGLTPH